MWFDIHKILSYNALLNILIGERGCGKTFACSEFCVSQFIKKGYEFVYLRRFKTDLKKSVPKFFGGLIKEGKFLDHELSNKGNTFYVDGKIAGYALTLTEAQSIKSTNFPNVKYIVFDEFIIEGTSHHYLKNEVESNFLSILESVARLRDFRVFMLANSVNLLNPYFIYFNLTIPYNSDIKKFNDGLIVMQYMKNLEYREVKRMGDERLQEISATIESLDELENRKGYEFKRVKERILREGSMDKNIKRAITFRENFMESLKQASALDNYDKLMV